jgi:CHAT domain
MSRPPPPVVLFAFANDRVEKARYLRNLPEELRRVREAMAIAEQAGLCEVVPFPNATVGEVLDAFQETRYHDRVAVFHFGGHAGSGVLLFESPDGAARASHAGGFARFLGEQRGLALVFLNGCSTRGQVKSLLAAGVPAVVATSQDIPDAVATELSSRFYKALASGVPLRTAFKEAAGAVQTQAGEAAQPWDLYVKPGAEEHVERWSLPVAARDPLFGLPTLPAMDLPLAPFKHLAPFTESTSRRGASSTLPRSPVRPAPSSPPAAREMTRPPPSRGALDARAAGNTTEPACLIQSAGSARFPWCGCIRGKRASRLRDQRNRTGRRGTHRRVGRIAELAGRHRLLGKPPAFSPRHPVNS